MGMYANTIYYLENSNLFSYCKCTKKLRNYKSFIPAFTVKTGIYIQKSPIFTKTGPIRVSRSEEHTSELQSRQYLVCRLLLEKKNTPTPLTLSAAGRLQHHHHTHLP